tara:strand:+ start:514 stop:1224 length:711 start_codon:yes stop_codon:yes gene_type:complete
MIKLNVNIDHVATLRQSRLGFSPDPIKAAKIVKESRANGIVMHLREDRRHIQDEDLVRIKKELRFHLNLEAAATKEMIRIANKIKPDVITFVPEKRKELTTEGGLNVKKNLRVLKSRLIDLNPKIKVMLFIDPVKTQIDSSLILNVYGIEINTGKYSESKGLSKINELKKIRKAAKYANENQLYVAAGHGLNEKNLRMLVRIKQIKEYNIGHSIVANSVFVGLKESIKKIQDILKV